MVLLILERKCQLILLILERIGEVSTLAAEKISTGFADIREKIGEVSALAAEKIGGVSTEVAVTNERVTAYSAIVTTGFTEIKAEIKDLRSTKLQVNWKKPKFLNNFISYINKKYSVLHNYKGTHIFCHIFSFSQ